MKKNNKFLNVVIGFIFSNLYISSGYAYFFETENTIEVFDPRIVITRNHTGYVSGRECEKCELTKFVVAPSTQAFNIKGQKVDLQEANKWSRKAALFSYVKKTKRLTAITEERLPK